MLRIAVLGVATVAFAAVLAGGAGADEPKPEAGMAGKVTASAGFDKQHGPHSQVECTVTSGGANTNLDCDDPFPNNEPDIEVDPVDPVHMIASSNDYGTCCDQFYTTFDGGATWTTGNMSRNNPQANGQRPGHGVRPQARRRDPLVAELTRSSFRPARRATATSSVSTSQDGGVTWDPAVVVDYGLGCDTSNTQLFNDKEWIVTDNNSDSPPLRADVPDVDEVQSRRAARTSLRRSSSRTRDDGGKHWTKPQEISGSNAALCTFQVSGTAGRCDEDQFSVPDGRPRRNRLRRLPERAEPGTLGAGRGLRRPVPARQVDGRRQDLVEPDLRRRPRGRLA